MTAAFEIRAARLEDSEAISALVGELGYALEPDAVRRQIESLAASAGDRVIVATSGAQVMALMSAHVFPYFHRGIRVCRLTSLVVSENHRGAGAGKMLVRACEAFAREAECAWVEVTSADARLEAHAFYNRLGYAVTGLRFRKKL